jgi:hypothetical protein
VARFYGIVRLRGTATGNRFWYLCTPVRTGKQSQVPVPMSSTIRFYVSSFKIAQAIVPVTGIVNELLLGCTGTLHVVTNFLRSVCAGTSICSFQLCLDQSEIALKVAVDRAQECMRMRGVFDRAVRSCVLNEPRP